MQALETPATLPLEKKSVIRWKRIVIGAFLSEVAVIGLLSAVMGAQYLMSPHQTAAQYQEFAENAGYDLAAPAAAVATFVFALWAVRPLNSGFVRNGVLLGTIATLLTLGFVFGARPQDRWMYVISYIVRIAAGYCGGLVAQKMNRAV
jgi:hypothetical protein